MRQEKRSRRGCRQCRSGHHKCDEATPVCGRCQRRSQSCDYNAGVRWRKTVTVSSSGGATGTTRRSHKTDAGPPPGLLQRLNIPSTSAQSFADADEVTAYTYCKSSHMPEERETRVRLMAVLDVHHLAGELQSRDTIHNPYRRLAVLGTEHRVLLNTVVSCASEHMALRGICSTELAVSHHDRAIRSIREQLEDWHPSHNPPNFDDVLAISPDQALLAAVLLQVAVVVFSNWSSGGSAAMHLASAFHILDSHGYLDTRRSADSWLCKALLQRFAVADLGISAFQRSRRPLMTPSRWFANCISHSLDHSEPSFADMTGYHHCEYKLLLQVMHLASDVDAKSCSTNAVLNDAIRLETEIRLHDRRNLDVCIGQTGSVKHMTLLRRAYTNLALLLLFRRVFMDAVDSARVQHAVCSILSCIDGIPITSNDNGQTFFQSGIDSSAGLPFYLAARDAINPDDHSRIRAQHNEWSKVYANPARPRLMEIAERIWANRSDQRGTSDSQSREIEDNSEIFIF